MHAFTAASKDANANVCTQRFLFVKLTYHDCTPQDYEPPYFKSDSSQSFFLRKPFHM